MFSLFQLLLRFLRVAARMPFSLFVSRHRRRSNVFHMPSKAGAVTLRSLFCAAISPLLDAGRAAGYAYVFAALIEFSTKMTHISAKSKVRETSGYTRILHAAFQKWLQQSPATRGHTSAERSASSSK